MTQDRINSRSAARQFTRAAVLLLWAAGVGWLTLLPSGDGASPTSPFCVLCGSRGTADVLLNVVLFSPLGWAIGFRSATDRRSLLGVVLLGALLSLGIEAAQLYIPGRAPTVRDIAANALGAGVGWLIAVHLTSWVDRWRATRTAVAFAVLTPAVAVALNSWLLMPYVAPVPLWGQWSPDLGRLERWTGRVHAVLLGAQPIRIGRLSPDPDTARAIRAALKRRANVRVSLTLGAVPAGRAPIVGIADARSEHLLLVSQDGEDLVIQRFVRGSQLRLETPVDRIVGLFNGRAPGDSTTLELTWADGRSCATIDERAVCAEPSHGQRLWVYLLWNASEHRWLEVLLDVLTSALLWLPLAWIIPQRGRSYVLVPLGVAVGLSVGAHLIAPVGMLTIADVSGGLLAGVFAWRSERRRTVRAAG